jgi:DnaK suppressor protein
METKPKRSKNGYLNKKQIEALRQKLLAEKERILNKDLVDQSRYCLDKEELSDPLDEASANIQASQEIRFRNRENLYLKKIHQTLDRIENEDFGKCNECDAEITFERLVARPTADMCIACKEERESEEKNNFFLKKSKSLGKTLQEMGRP